MPPPFTYLFGPVPSRRLGRSLGVDLTPRKTCTFDCVFCQLGPTTHKTVQRQAYVPTAAVIAELTQWLHAGGTADYITLAGSGEPTLHADFGAIIQFLRAATTIPVALLTNGSLLGDPAVRAAAAQANVVKASLSAWDQPSFASINRPHAALTCAAVVEGLRQFRTAFSGTLWLEVFIVWGMNSIPMDVQAIARLAQTVHPDLVQLNTAVRPPAEEFVQALPRARLEELAALFDPPAEVIVFLFLAVWIPCCTSDIVFPLLFASAQRTGAFAAEDPWR